MPAKSRAKRTRTKKSAPPASMINAMLAAINLPREKPAGVVDFSSRTGAVCPQCGCHRAPVTSSRPWFGGPEQFHRQRFHKCGRCDLSFQSFETSKTD